MATHTRVTLEIGPKSKKVVAVAPDWPWLEGGRRLGRRQSNGYATIFRDIHTWQSSLKWTRSLTPSRTSTRRKIGAHLALSTASSFRASIAPGDILAEDYQAALPNRCAGCGRAVEAALASGRRRTEEGIPSSVCSVYSPAGRVYSRS